MKPNVILLGLSSLLFAGCGVLFTHGPPTGHEQMDSFRCTQHDAGSVLDAFGGGAAVLVAASAAANPDWHDNAGRIVAVGLAWGVVSAFSAANGLKKVKRCQAAHRQLAIRHGQHPADLPPEGPFVQAVVVSPADTRLAVGEQRQLSAMAYKSSGTLMPDLPFLWSSSNDAIASVSGAGLVTAHAAGRVVITANAGNVVATARIVVTAPR
jgi:hypothetical protein